MLQYLGEYALSTVLVSAASPSNVRSASCVVVDRMPKSCCFLDIV